MTPGEVYESLNETFNDWDGLLANPRFSREAGFISWTKFSGGRLKEPITKEQVLEVVNEGQFSFQSAEDGSIFQLLYSFDGNGALQVARLAFYLLKTRGSFEDGTAELVSNSWIRVDYDRAATRGILHRSCHLHLHGFPDSRIIVDGVPGPRQFVEFVISTCYPDYYQVHRLNDGGEIGDPKILTKVNECSLKGGEPTPVLHFATPK